MAGLAEQVTLCDFLANRCYVGVCDRSVVYPLTNSEAVGLAGPVVEVHAITTNQSTIVADLRYELVYDGMPCVPVALETSLAGAVIPRGLALVVLLWVVVLPDPRCELDASLTPALARVKFVQVLSLITFRASFHVLSIPQERHR